MLILTGTGNGLENEFDSNYTQIRVLQNKELFESSGVSRKSEWEGTKWQKLTVNKIHLERIPL